MQYFSNFPNIILDFFYDHFQPSYWLPNLKRQNVDKFGISLLFSTAIHVTHPVFYVESEYELSFSIEAFAL